MTAIAVEQIRKPRAIPRRIPPLRLTQVELRKMFDTRSGFWLMASIVIAALLATGGPSCSSRTTNSPTRPSSRRSTFQWRSACRWSRTCRSPANGANAAA